MNGLLFVLTFIAANLPWLTERRFIFFSAPKEGKKHSIRFFEWLCFYFLMLLLVTMYEKKRFGVIHSQDWEFYAITVCLFMVFSFPGFVYHNDLRKYLS